MTTYHIVHISDSALMHLCLAGLESYLIGKKPKETYGLLWGNVVDLETEEESYKDYRIDHVTTDIAARRRSDEVEPNNDGLIIKQTIVKAYSPHLSFLGDFHTHPYGYRDNVERDKLFAFSEADRCSVENRLDAEYWREKELKVCLVLTIRKMERRGRRKPRRPPGDRKYVIEWTMDRYRFWLAAYVVQPLGKRRLFLVPREDNWKRYRWMDRIPVTKHRVEIYVPSVMGIHLHDRLDFSDLRGA